VHSSAKIFRRLRASAGFEWAELAYQMGDRLEPGHAERSKKNGHAGGCRVGVMTSPTVAEQHGYHQLQFIISEAVPVRAC